MYYLSTNPDINVVKHTLDEGNRNKEIGQCKIPNHHLQLKKTRHLQGQVIFIAEYTYVSTFILSMQMTYISNYSQKFYRNQLLKKEMTLNLPFQNMTWPYGLSKSRFFIKPILKRWFQQNFFLFLHCCSLAQKSWTCNFHWAQLYINLTWPIFGCT